MTVALAHSRPTAPATRASTYLAHGMVSPITWGPLVAVTVALVMGCPLAALAAIMVAGLGALLVARSERFRERVDLARRRRRRDALVSAYEARRRYPVAEVRELAELVSSIDEHAPHVASRFDLDGLLARWVRLSDVADQCAAALGSVCRQTLVRNLEDVRAGGGLHDPRLPILERRLQLWDGTRVQSERLLRERATTAELIRLLAQHAARPADVATTDLVGTVLAELDALDEVDAVLTADDAEASRAVVHTHAAAA
ncbi:MAG TPA: hypothetical protein VHE35_19260 [Kofleriaceae bacterium]|nr:hypothetical protein [Kofleriaceae bacterium]